MPTTKKATTKKTTKPKVKATTKPTKEIKLEFVKMVQEKNAMHKREEKANEYIAQCKAKRARKRKIKKDILYYSCVCLIAIVLAIAVKGKSTSGSTTQSKEDLVPINEYDGSVYFMRGELQGNHVVLEDGNIHEVDKADANYTSEPMQVTVTLNDNGTEDVDDDIIVNIK